MLCMCLCMYSFLRRTNERLERNELLILTKLRSKDTEQTRACDPIDWLRWAVVVVVVVANRNRTTSHFNQAGMWAAVKSQLNDSRAHSVFSHQNNTRIWVGGSDDRRWSFQWCCWCRCRCCVAKKLRINSKLITGKMLHWSREISQDAIERTLLLLQRRSDLRFAFIGQHDLRVYEKTLHINEACGCATYSYAGIFPDMLRRKENTSCARKKRSLHFCTKKNEHEAESNTCADIADHYYVYETKQNFDAWKLGSV